MQRTRCCRRSTRWDAKQSDPEAGQVQILLKIGIAVLAAIWTGQCAGQGSIEKPPINRITELGTDAFSSLAAANFEKFRIVRDIWDPALNSRILFLRCNRSTECLPFVVRAPGFPRKQSTPKQILSKQASRFEPRSPEHATVIRGGQTASMIWEDAGIKMTVSVICLDAGAVGERIRVRIARPGGKVLTATVMNSGLVRSSM